MWNPYDFSGKKIIVTGATSGIGKTAAIMLSKQGANVCLMGRSEERLKKTMLELEGSQHVYFVKDFKEDGDYKAIFDSLVQDGHKIDGLVHCAGMARILPLDALNRKYMDESMAVNLYSFVEMTKLLSKKKYHDKANIVAVSSIAVQYPQKCQGLYAATKAAMNVMVQALAMELAGKNIRINTVMPSSTNTPMLKEAFELLSEEEIKEKTERQILGIEEPEDIANIILFLLSDASQMITGRYVYADGGYFNL